MFAYLMMIGVWFLGALVGTSVAEPPYLPEHVWPISGTTTHDGPLSSTFGPRLKASENDRYDFHRGIDIPAERGTPVHAVAAGEIRLAGEYSFYRDKVVQIRHRKEGGKYYYSNYLHLSEVLVTAGQRIQRGDIIGKTGVSDSGFSHLHFEIRDEGIYQQHCIHPFAVLPYHDAAKPEVTINNVALDVPARPTVQVTVTLPRTTGEEELDFNRVTVFVYEKVGSSLVLLDQRSYDSQQWNALYTPLPPEDPNLNLDHPSFNGVTIDPEPFNASRTLYVMHFTFHELLGGAHPDKLIFMALAEDVKGNFSLVQYSSKITKAGKEHR